MHELQYKTHILVR